MHPVEKMIKVPFKNPEVQAVFSGYKKTVRVKLLSLRQLIFDIASDCNEVGELEETLKWGQPSYLTTKPKSGTTIRIDHVKSDEEQYGMYFHCQSSLIETYRKIYPQEFTYQGNRAIIFNVQDKIPLKKLSHCILLALTYHLKKEIASSRIK
jgi:hypothetical protein